MEIKPYGKNNQTCTQSKYEIAPKLPIRGVILGPSGSGKGILLQNLILNIYKNCFERIYIFSPSINVDNQWIPVKNYIKNELNVDEKLEKIYFDEYIPEELDEIINIQSKIIIKQKQNKDTKMFSILIVVDDFADDPHFSRHSKLLHSLFTRGRHNFISTIVSTQKYNAISPIIRVNSTALFVFKLRSNQDLNTFLEETSAVLKNGKSALLEIYNVATKEQYSFLYVNLLGDINNMFFIRFDKRIKLTM